MRDHLAALWAGGGGERTAAASPASCPSSRVVEWERKESSSAPGRESGPPDGPVFTHWPIKLQLVPPGASFLDGADLVLMADCVGFAWGGLRRELPADRALLIGCPKFEDFDAAQARLTEILRGSDVRSLTVVHMEVPCCAGYLHMGREARAAAGKQIPLRRIVVGIRGETRQEEG